MITHCIPCSGRGSRFISAGYKDPKPFIDVLGEPMIARVLENIGYPIEPTDDRRYILLFLKEHFNHEVVKTLQKRPDTIVISVDKVTEGAACTALLAKEYINNEYPLWIGDCDHLIGDRFYIECAEKYFKKNNADAGLICHLNDHPKWSYCKIRDGKVIEVVEKQVVSNVSNTGDYFWNKGKYAVEAMERMIEKNDRSKGEFYIAPSYSYLIADNKKVLPYMINEHIGLGTPEDLQMYINTHANSTPI